MDTTYGVYRRMNVSAGRKHSLLPNVKTISTIEKAKAVLTVKKKRVMQKNYQVSFIGKNPDSFFQS